MSSDHSFKAGPFLSTEIGGTQHAMRAERAYVTLLGQARSYRVAGKRLTLYDAGGNESLIFEKTGG